MPALPVRAASARPRTGCEIRRCHERRPIAAKSSYLGKIT
jgi:hypothetical protein